jgi:hypothetical protein
MKLASTSVFFALLIALFASPAISQDAEGPPPVGTIDFYGLRSMSSSDALAKLPFRVGEPPTLALEPEMNAKVAKALGVGAARVELVCCIDGGSRSELFIGVQETAHAEAPRSQAPSGKVRLPAELVASYDEFLKRLYEALLKGDVPEDRSQGHALGGSPGMREIQERFVQFAASDQRLLMRVLQESADDHQREVAAHILGYAKSKRAVVGALTRAASDPSTNVRNVATRALAIIAEYAQSHPRERIEIDPAPFVRMLDSLDWTDRNKSLMVLVAMTANRDARLLRAVRASAMPSLIEMCRWTRWDRAGPPCAILRRAIGLPDNPDPGSRTETLARAGADGTEPP